MDKKEFGIFLTKLREKSGYKSQRKLSIESGISSATLSRIESGVQKPQPDTLKTLSKFLKNVTYKELLIKAGYIYDDMEFWDKADEYLKGTIPYPAAFQLEQDLLNKNKEVNPDQKMTEGLKDKTNLNEKEEWDIAKDLERMLNDLESKEAMAFDGEPTEEDEETLELLKSSLEHSMRIAKKLAKKKFTPKKYKN